MHGLVGPTLACGALLALAAFACTSLNGLMGGDGSGSSAGDASVPPTDAPAEAPTTIDAEADAPAVCDAATSFAADPDNCGRCGHGCMGGACNAGQCAAVNVETGQGSVSWVVLDESSIFWTNGSSVRACPKSGCGSAGALTIVEGRAGIGEIVAGGGQVFWGECASPTVGGVYSCPVAGCTAGPAVLATTGCVQGIGLDATNGEIYYSAAGLYRCPVSGCAGSPSLVAEAGYVSSIVLQKTSVYFSIAQGYVRNGVSLGGLGWCPTPYCSPTGGALLATAPGLSVSTPTFVGSYVYWAATEFKSGDEWFDAPIVATVSSGQIVRADLAGADDGGAATILIDAGAPTFAVADDGGLYFNDYAAGTISRCMLPACEGGAAIIAQGQGKPFCMAQDEAAIYWGNWGDGRIVKLAK